MVPRCISTVSAPAARSRAAIHSAHRALPSLPGVRGPMAVCATTRAYAVSALNESAALAARCCGASARCVPAPLPAEHAMSATAATHIAAILFNFISRNYIFFL